MNEKSVARGFNRAAIVYDFFVWVVFGNSIHRSQVYFFSDLPQCNRVLILGGGTGKILPPLLASKKVDEVTYIDISEKMLEKAKRKVTSESKVKFICGSYRSIPNGAQYDLIITPYFLDCFTQDEMNKVMKYLSTHHIVNGIWLFSDFNISEKNKFWSAYSKAMVKSLYVFFDFICGLNTRVLPDFRKAYLKLKYSEKESVFFAKGMLRSTFYHKMEK